ncbi:adaptor complexes medium subunit family protein [Cystoisospora suis]|uniref:Adaptor complexes medium subunit family protein n=1 Tax=Cystoisospora suis TaxID=483139 RepID=A0A2C6KXE8_9APIC|nr:adaptor complexes medium subunit family protein [Cystoisospora suis]
MCSLRGWWIFEVSPSGDSSTAETLYSSADEDEGEDTDISSHEGGEDDNTEGHRIIQSERERERRNDMLGGGLAGLYAPRGGGRTRRRTRKASRRYRGGPGESSNSTGRDMNFVRRRGRKYNDERDASREESQQGVRSCVRLLFSRRYPTVDHRWKRIAGPSYVPLPSDKVLRHAFMAQLLNEPEDDTWGGGGGGVTTAGCCSTPSTMIPSLSESFCSSVPSSFSSNGGFLGTPEFSGSMSETPDMSLCETAGVEEEDLLCEGQPSFYYDFCQERYFQEPTWPCGPTAMLVLPPSSTTPPSHFSCHRDDIYHGDNSDRLLSGRHVGRGGDGGITGLSETPSFSSYPEQIDSYHAASSTTAGTHGFSGTGCTSTSSTANIGPSGSSSCTCQPSNESSSPKYLPPNGTHMHHTSKQQNPSPPYLYVSDDHSKGLCSLQVPSSSFSSSPCPQHSSSSASSSSCPRDPSMMAGAETVPSFSSPVSTSCVYPPLNSSLFSILWPVVFVRKAPTGSSSPFTSSSSSSSAGLTGAPFTPDGSTKLRAPGVSTPGVAGGRGGAAGGGDTGGGIRDNSIGKAKKKKANFDTPSGNLFQMARRKQGEGGRFLVALAALALDEAPGLGCLHPATANCFDLPQVTAAFHVLDQLMDLYISLSLSLPSSVSSYSPPSSPLLSRRALNHTSTSTANPSSSPHLPPSTSSASPSSLARTKTSTKNTRYTDGSSSGPTVSTTTSTSSLAPSSQSHHRHTSSPSTPHTGSSSQRSTGVSGASGSSLKASASSKTTTGGGGNEDFSEDKDGGHDMNMTMNDISSSSSLSLLLALQLALPFGRPKLTSPALLRDAFESLSALPTSYSFLPPASGVPTATTATVNSEEEDDETGFLGSDDDTDILSQGDYYSEERGRRRREEARRMREKNSRSASSIRSRKGDERSKSLGRDALDEEGLRRGSSRDRIEGAGGRRRKHSSRRRRREGRGLLYEGEEDEDNHDESSRGTSGQYCIPPRPTWTKGSVQQLSQLRERKLRQYLTSLSSSLAASSSSFSSTQLSTAAAQLRALQVLHWRRQMQSHKASTTSSIGSDHSHFYPATRSKTEDAWWEEGELDDPFQYPPRSSRWRGGEEGEEDEAMNGWMVLDHEDTWHHRDRLFRSEYSSSPFFPTSSSSTMTPIPGGSVWAVPSWLPQLTPIGWSRGPPREDHEETIPRGRRSSSGKGYFYAASDGDTPPSMKTSGGIRKTSDSSHANSTSLWSRLGFGGRSKKKTENKKKMTTKGDYNGPSYHHDSAKGSSTSDGGGGGSHRLLSGGSTGSLTRRKKKILSPGGSRIRLDGSDEYEGREEEEDEVGRNERDAFSSVGDDLLLYDSHGYPAHHGNRGSSSSSPLRRRRSHSQHRHIVRRSSSVSLRGRRWSEERDGHSANEATSLTMERRDLFFRQDEDERRGASRNSRILKKRETQRSLHKDTHAITLGDRHANFLIDDTLFQAKIPGKEPQMIASTTSSSDFSFFSSIPRSLGGVKATSPHGESEAKEPFWRWIKRGSWLRFSIVEEIHCTMHEAQDRGQGGGGGMNAGDDGKDDIVDVDVQCSVVGGVYITACLLKKMMEVSIPITFPRAAVLPDVYVNPTARISNSPAELLKFPATSSLSSTSSHDVHSRGENVAKSSSRLPQDESDDKARQASSSGQSASSVMKRNENLSIQSSPPPPPPLVISCVPSLGVNSSLLCKYRFGDLPFYPIKGLYQVKEIRPCVFRLLLQLQIHSGVAGRFDTCSIWIPFGHKGLIESHDLKASQGTFRIADDRRAILWALPKHVKCVGGRSETEDASASLGGRAAGKASSLGGSPLSSTGSVELTLLGEILLSPSTTVSSRPRQGGVSSSSSFSSMPFHYASSSSSPQRSLRNGYGPYTSAYDLYYGSNISRQRRRSSSLTSSVSGVYARDPMKGYYQRIREGRTLYHSSYTNPPIDISTAASSCTIPSSSSYPYRRRASSFSFEYRHDNGDPTFIDTPPSFQDLLHQAVRDEEHLPLAVRRFLLHDLHDARELQAREEAKYDQEVIADSLRNRGSDLRTTDWGPGEEGRREGEGEFFTQDNGTRRKGIPFYGEGSCSSSQVDETGGGGGDQGGLREGMSTDLGDTGRTGGDASDRRIDREGRAVSYRDEVAARHQAKGGQPHVWGGNGGEGIKSDGPTTAPSTTLLSSSTRHDAVSYSSSPRASSPCSLPPHSSLANSQTSHSLSSPTLSHLLPLRNQANSNSEMHTRGNTLGRSDLTTCHIEIDPRSHFASLPSGVSIQRNFNRGGLLSTSSQSSLFYRNGEGDLIIEPSQGISSTRGGGGGPGRVGGGVACRQDHTLQTSSTVSPMTGGSTRRGLIRGKTDPRKKVPYKKRVVVGCSSRMGRKNFFTGGDIGGGRGRLTEREEILLHQGLNNFLAVIQFEAKGYTLTGCQIDKEAVSLYPHEHLELIEVARRREEIEQEERHRKHQATSSGGKGANRVAGSLSLFHGFLPTTGSSSSGRGGTPETDTRGGGEGLFFSSSSLSPSSGSQQGHKGGTSWFGLLGGGGGDRGEGKKKGGDWMKSFTRRGLEDDNDDSGGCSVSIFKRTTSGRYVIWNALGDCKASKVDLQFDDFDEEERGREEDKARRRDEGGQRESVYGGASASTRVTQPFFPTPPSLTHSQTPYSVSSSTPPRISTPPLSSVCHEPSPSATLFEPSDEKKEFKEEEKEEGGEIVTEETEGSSPSIVPVALEGCSSPTSQDAAGPSLLTTHAEENTNDTSSNGQ